MKQMIAENISFRDRKTHRFSFLSFLQDLKNGFKNNSFLYFIYVSTQFTSKLFTLQTIFCLFQISNKLITELKF